jgi:hypothetical protein
MIRRIRDLLYEQGFTISGARNKLQELVQQDRDKKRAGEVMLQGLDDLEDNLSLDEARVEDAWQLSSDDNDANKLQLLRRELFEIRDLLN